MQAAILVFLQDPRHKAEGIAAVDGERQMELFGPTQLGFKGVELLVFEGRIPVKIEANFAYTYIYIAIQLPLHQGQY